MPFEKAEAKPAAMTREDAEKQIVAAFKKEGYEQIRVKTEKEDPVNVHVVGLGIKPNRVVVSLAELNAATIKTALDVMIREHKREMRSVAPQDD